MTQAEQPDPIPVANDEVSAATGETLSFNQPNDDQVQQIAELEAKIAELNDQFLRARAEMENVRRRAAEDVQAANKYAISRFASELLVVHDSLEMALSDTSGQFDTLKVGVDMTLKQLNSAFEKVNLVAIHPLGEKLDPHQHQAISMIEHEAEPNTVVHVMQKGYRLVDRVLRPAMVVVSKGRA